MFGGKVLLLAGNFRQILPVVRLGRRSDVVDAALSRSALWQQYVVLQLHRKCVSKNVAVINNMQLNCVSMPTGCCSWKTQSNGDIHLLDEL